MTVKAIGCPRFPALALLWALLAAGSACHTEWPSGNPDDARFEGLALAFSEEAGYFDTDNLISNESSYQHALSALPTGAGEGRAYLGVGPGQNFTYIARLRPQIALIIDIRRDNQLFHLYWKELFERSENRSELLSRLLGRPLPDGYVDDPGLDAPGLISRVQMLKPDSAFFEKEFASVWASLRKRFPMLIQESDRNRLLRLWQPYFDYGFSLRFSSHGRRPRSFYPSWAGLIMATDLDNLRGHYLEREEDFQFLRILQQENRLIPITGDFAGPRALRAVGAYLKRSRTPVSAFYLSNVEFYLFQSGTHRRFVDNLRELPFDDRSLLIRSHFGNVGRHPETRPGHFVTCLVQSAEQMLRLDSSEPYQDYWDLVMRDYLPMSSLKRD